MATKTVSGIIKDAGDFVEENCFIKLDPVISLGNTYKGASYIESTDADGNYSINVPIGNYDAFISYDFGKNYVRLGRIQIITDTPTPISLSVLLNNKQIPTNTQVLAAQSAANAAETSANSAAADAATISSSLIDITNNTNDIANITADLSSTTVAIGDGSGVGQGIDGLAIGNQAGIGQDESAVAIGDTAGNSNQGKKTVAIGFAVGLTDQGDFATALGAGAGQTGQGGSATAVGNFAGKTTQGNFAGGFGAYAGQNNQGDYSIAMGFGAGYTNQPTNSIHINADNTPGQPTSTKTIYIGRSDYSVQIGDGSVQSVSDARDKFDIQDIPLGLDFINALSPKFYKYDIRELYETHEDIIENGEVVGAFTTRNLPDGSKAGTRYHSGFLAQEVKQTMDDFGVDFGLFRDQEVNATDEHKDLAKDKLALCYQELIAIQAKAIQELSAKVDELSNTIDNL